MKRTIPIMPAHVMPQAFADRLNLSMAAAESLGQIGDPWVTKYVLNHPKPFALGWSRILVNKDPGALPELQKRAQSTDPFIQRLAQEALDALQDAERYGATFATGTPQAAGRDYSYFSTQFQFVPEGMTTDSLSTQPATAEQVALLAKAAMTTSQKIRETAQAGLANPKPDVVELGRVYADLLNNPFREVYLSAMKGCGVLRARECVDTLREAVKSSPITSVQEGISMKDSYRLEAANSASLALSKMEDKWNFDYVLSHPRPFAGYWGGLLPPYGTKAIPRLKELAARSDQETRSGAAYAIQCINNAYPGAAFQGASKEEIIAAIEKARDQRLLQYPNQTATLEAQAKMLPPDDAAAVLATILKPGVIDPLVDVEHAANLHHLNGDQINLWKTVIRALGATKSPVAFDILNNQAQCLMMHQEEPAREIKAMIAQEYTAALSELGTPLKVVVGTGCRYDLSGMSAANKAWMAKSDAEHEATSRTFKASFSVIGNSPHVKITVRLNGVPISDIEGIHWDAREVELNAGGPLPYQQAFSFVWARCPPLGHYPVFDVEVEDVRGNSSSFPVRGYWGGTRGGTYCDANHK